MLVLDLINLIELVERERAEFAVGHEREETVLICWLGGIVVPDVSRSEHLANKILVEFMRSVAERSNPHGVECFEHISVETKGDEGVCVTETSGEDLDVEE